MSSPSIQHKQQQHQTPPSTTTRANSTTSPSLSSAGRSRGATGRKYSSEGYRSTPDSRSSVLSRAREYTRRIEEEENSNRRSTSASPPTTSGSSEKENNDDLVGRQQPHIGCHTTTSSSSSPRKNKSYREVQAQAKSAQQQQQEQQQSSDSMTTPSSVRSAGRRSNISAGEDQQQQHDVAAGGGPTEQQQHQPVVSPELLVDALSGHEDGLLAIAERLMEHYDSGYDAMGEAIIDAFADVQKLFQHVVEAAHMEGAAFEASRREEEMKELRERAAAADNFNVNSAGDHDVDDNGATSPSSGPVRHDEFIDQDVKDCLNEAIKMGAPLKDSNRHIECYQLYEQACQSASALLPVDSDHRGRLQLSIARAESMSPDRGCAILRYAMDDVLRSGLRPGKILPTIDPSKRADVVLSKPKGHPAQGSAAPSSVVQSNEEALNSLVAEMKEILDAPVYKDTPLQDVAKRFWTALQENQKLKSKTEERLEHNLGKLKGDFLLARAEWEEKLNNAQEQAELYKRKYQTAKDGKETSLMEDARSMMSQVKLSSLSGHDSMDLDSSGYPSLGGNSLRSGGTPFRVPGSRPEFQRGVESVASMGSNLAHHAKSLVGQFACTANNDRTGQVINADHATEAWRDRRAAASAQADSDAGGGRSYREGAVATATGNFAQGPRHVDV